MRSAIIAGISSAVVAALILSGCSTGGGTDPASGPPKADLSDQFAEADSPRVPARDDLLGTWKVVQPSSPPDGQSGRFADIEFGNAEQQAYVEKEKLESDIDPAVTIALDIGRCPTAGAQAAFISDDGRLHVKYKPVLAMLSVYCASDDGTFRGSAIADGSGDYIAIDKQGNLWIKGDNGVFKFQKTPAGVAAN